MTEDEVKVLKEIAQNMAAMNKVRKLFTTSLLWLSGVVAAGLIVWDAVSHLGSKS